MQHSLTAQQFGRIRLDARMDQTQFGEVFGVSRQTVSLWERGAAAIPPTAAAQCWLVAKYGVHFAADPWKGQVNAA